VSADLIYRTVPFLALALVLFGWAPIELLRTRLRDMDLMTLTIVFAGLAGGLYLTSLALNYSPLPFRWRAWWFEAIRISLWLTIPGIPVIYRNVIWAWRDRHAGRFRTRAAQPPAEPP
jgi:hypothetical protein